ncbi:MAG: Aspartate racemase [Burkholderia gladioli]|nr:MAG: Aspartate racemase [Burkholderia gladioli]
MASRLCYPEAGDDDGSGDAVTEAVYGEDGIRSGAVAGRPVALLRRACASLVAQGADVIVPGLTEIALVADALGPLPVPLVDANAVYARHVLDAGGLAPRRPEPFRIGVVGGVGPTATVDFLAKMVGNTPAARDQDHLKVIVEQNPQIPDRTAHLIGDGPDPTVSLYATCKRLEQGGANLVAIPCNTAHAFVERIQPRLSIPIVNMLSVTAPFLRERFPSLREAGVLATSGTLASGVYGDALAAAGAVADRAAAGVAGARDGGHLRRAGCEGRVYRRCLPRRHRGGARRPGANGRAGGAARVHGTAVAVAGGRAVGRGRDTGRSHRRAGQRLHRSRGARAGYAG